MPAGTAATTNGDDEDQGVREPRGLPGLTADDLDTVINWALGADSTAYLARVLTDAAAWRIVLERTAVLY